MRNASKLARYKMMQNGRNGDYSNNGGHEKTYPGYSTPEIMPENRFRDRRGREHYDNGRYAPMRNEYNTNYSEPESRGISPMRIREEFGGYQNNYEIESKQDGDEWEENPRVIGFAAASYSKGQHQASPLTREMAEEWMHRIKNEDGTRGAHWSLDEVKRVMQQKGIECDPLKLWVAVNAEYSDRYAINKKYGVDKLDFYIDSAIAYWLKDQDAVKDKLSAYYTHVVKH